MPLFCRFQSCFFLTIFLIMADVHEPETRSYNMSRIQAKDTKPEMMVRKAIHKLGYRYTLHKKSLPGKPDLYFRKYNAVIEVNGCFWHGHDCHFYTEPKSNKDYWVNKIQKNKERDKKNIDSLISNGLRVLVIWECALIGKEAIPLSAIIKKTTKWLQSKKEFLEIRGQAEK